MDSYSPIEEYRLLYRKIKPYHGVSAIKIGDKVGISFTLYLLSPFEQIVYFSSNQQKLFVSIQFNSLQPLDASFPLGEGDWTNVIIPGDVTAPGFTHLRSYLISGLLPESEYECLVQARNRFGWSDASRLFTFFTSTKG